MTDPLLELIRDYRRHHDAYNASAAPDGSEVAMALWRAWQDPYDMLMENPPPATTLESAIEAIRLVRDEERDCGCQPDLTVNVLTAALAFFDSAGADG